MEDSPEQIEKRTLLCRHVPANLLRRQSLKEHFEQFGTVLKVLVNKEASVANVEFENHEQAVQARNLGTNYQGQVIQITFKRGAVRTKSNSQESPATLAGRSRLFGKALAPSLGDAVRQPSTKATVTGRTGLFRGVGRGATSSSGRGSLFGARNTDASSTVPATSRSHTSPPSDRAPVQAGLYDDLPPPGDWEEEEVPHIQSKSPTRSPARSAKTQWKPSLVKPGAGAVNPFKKVNPQNIAISAAKAQAKLTSTQPSTSAEATPPSFGIPAGPSSDKVASSGLFGKTVKSELDKKPVFGQTGNFFTESNPSSETGSKLLFGKPVAARSTETAIPVVAASQSGGGQENSGLMKPSLFGKPVAAGRSQSPSAATSFFNRASSPARQTRGVSPASIMSLPFKHQRSPSPAVRPIISQSAAEPQEASEEVEFILPASLSSLTNTAAHTVSERQAVLAKREALMRQGVSKESDISKAKATRGCCPDMCPERERYIREERIRVHVYEMVPGTETQPQMDHARAVKEYSRSSADQEEPLPLELRPSHVLLTTMQYLCNNILDLGGDGAWSDWYEFLWDRTRAIRKDITQQHLCSPVAVGLVERCVRFHIYCGARLVEEDPMVFDSKINNENLTKCLQTLKELYTDLEKRGVACDNEAEFRAYVVLMNLNEGETLREAQQLRPEIRNSTHINFALSAYAALNDKNYVKFFKLVKQGTLMAACILHRYFNQMRYEALKIIMRSYTAPNGRWLILLNDVGTTLSFEEDGAELREFLDHYGLQADNLNRDHFIQPENPFGTNRARTLVEDKLCTTLGEAVYSSPLPPNIIKQPTTSFDQDGYFIGIVKPPPTLGQDVAEIEEPAPRARTTQLPPLDRIPPTTVKDTVKIVILDVLAVEIKQVCVESIQEETQYHNVLQICLQSLTEQLVKEETTLVCKQVLEEAKDERAAQDKADRIKLRNKLAEEYTNKCVEKVVASEIKKVCKEVYKEVKHTLKKQQRDRCADTVVTQLIDKHVMTLIHELAADVHQTDVTDRLALLSRQEHQTHVIRCRRFYKKWRAVYQKRTHVRRCMLNFPSAPPMMPQKRSKDFNITSDQLHLGKRSRLSIGTPKDMDSIIERRVAERKLRLIASNLPIRMGSVIKAAFEGTESRTDDYLKLILLLPHQLGEQDGEMCEWLKRKLSSGSVPTEPSSVQGKLHSLYNITLEKPNSTESFGVCVRSFQPSDLREAVVRVRTRPMMGANAAVFLLPYTEHADAGYWDQNKTLLSRYLNSKPIVPTLPLLIINPLNADADTVHEKLSVKELIDNEIASEVRIDSLDNTIDYSNQLVQSLDWLLKSRAAPPQLEFIDLKSYVESYLSRHFYTRVYQDHADRLKLDLMHQDINDLIEFWNETLANLCKHITEDQTEYSWPLYEHSDRYEGDLLVPGDEESTAELKTIIDNMKLEDYHYAGFYQSWEDACLDLSDYVEEIVEECESANNPSDLISKVESALIKTASVFNSQAQKRFYNPPQMTPYRCNMPWTDVIIAIADYLLCTISPFTYIMHRANDDYGTNDAELPPDFTMTYTVALKKAMKAASAQPISQPISPPITQPITPPITQPIFQPITTDEDDSYIDLETSIHTEPVSKLRTSLSNELNATRDFERYLESVLNDDLDADSDHKQRDSKENLDEDETDLSITEIVRNESEKAKAFEEFLMAALDE